MNVNTVSSTPAANFATAAQEALETAAQTKAEAAKGDRQAIRKLARSHAVQQSQTAPPPPASANGLSRTLNARA